MSAAQGYELGKMAFALFVECVDIVNVQSRHANSVAGGGAAARGIIHLRRASRHVSGVFHLAARRCIEQGARLL